MPTFDGGHCFLTALLPIETADVVDRGGWKSSHVQMVREALAVLPTAHQSPVTEKLACNSPFARCTRTHFARLVVLDDVIYNGRTPTSALLDQSDRTIPQPVDHLPSPYLIFVADFDAPEGTEPELREWLESLWTKMSPDLSSVFRHCFDFERRVRSASDFADYILACQIETTMPFNDYWHATPPLPSLSFGLLAAIGLAALAVVWIVLYAVLHALGWAAPFGWSWAFAGEALLLALLAAGPAICAVYRVVMTRGLKPFPAAPNADLPSVLKALYLQRRLIPFVARMQGESDQALFDEFGKLLDKVQVDNVTAPTQSPGVIG
jgi:hypothetical protein